MITLKRAAVWSLAALLCLQPLAAAAQNVAQPGKTVPLEALAYGTKGTPAIPVDDANGLPVRIMSGGGGGGSGTAGTEYTEDTAAAANPAGGMVICRRRDTLSASEVSADLDNIALNCTSKGQAHVFAEIGGTVAVTGPLTDTQIRATALPISAAALPLPAGAATAANQPPALAEDAAHVSGDKGTMALGVRKDTPASLAGTDGDYTSAIFDNVNRQWVHVGAVDGNVATTGASGSFVDGWDATQGAKGDTACASSASTCSVAAILKGLLAAAQDTSAVAVTASALPLPTGASTAANDTAIAGAQGTGSTYDPPSGGSGLLGYLSGIFKAVTGTLKAGGDVASGGADGGTNPVKIGCVFNTTLPTVSSGQRVDCQNNNRGLPYTLLPSTNGNAVAAVSGTNDGIAGQIGLAVVSQGMMWNGTTWDRLPGDVAGAVNQPYAVSSRRWQSAAASGGIVNTTTATQLAAAAGASLRNYIGSCQVSHDLLGAATELVIRDGAGGTVLWRGKLQTPAVEHGNISLPIPLKGTANTLLEVATLTAVTGGVFVNCQGYTAP